MSAKIAITAALEIRVVEGFPLPYHELVPKTQASDDGDMARVGLAINFTALYIWINDQMHILGIEVLVNAVIPQLLPERVRLTEKGNAALAEHKKGAATS